MKNTFITYIPGDLELKKDDFALNMKQFNINSTGFVYPDYEIIIECEENSDKFKLISNSTSEDEDLVVREKVVVLINHVSSFFTLIEDDKFINEIYKALLLPEHYIQEEEYEFNLTIMKSANV